MRSRKSQCGLVARKLERYRLVCLLIASPALCVAGCGTSIALRRPDPAVLFLAFGDSTTAGPSARDYPDILREKLAQPPETFANEGLSGETAEEGLDRLSELLEVNIFPNARIFLYWEGGNDINEFITGHDPLLVFSPVDPAYPFTNSLSALLEDITADVQNTVRLATEAGMDVYVTTYFPIITDFAECPALLFNIILPGQAVRANVYISLLNDSIRSAASASGASVVDVSSIGDMLVADTDNYFNCNHLSAVGNEIVAELFADELRAAGP